MKVELQRVVTLQSEVIVVAVVGGQVVEDGGAVLLAQIPRQVSLQDVQACTRSTEAGIKHLCSAPAASLPDGSARVIQVLIPFWGEAETAGDEDTGAAQTLHCLRHEGCPVLA